MHDNERRKKMTEEQKKLAEDNHNLIYFYARKYHMSKQDFEDMYGILAIGLCKAARDYDESRGRAFSTVAMGYMLNECRNAYRCDKYRNGKLSICSYNNIVPLSDEDDTTEYIDIMEGKQDVWDDVNLIEFTQFNEQLRKIAYLSYLGYDQKEIGEQVGITQSLVSRKLKKIRKEIENAYC